MHRWSGRDALFHERDLQMNSSSNVTITAPSTGNLTTTNGGTNVANILVWQSSSNSSGMDVDAGSTSVVERNHLSP